MDKDRESLARRNRRMAAFQHQLTYREKVRRWLLRAYSWMPTPLRQKPHRGTILLIRPDHLGDTLLTTPAIRLLKQIHPTSRLIALTGPWSAEVMAAYPEIDLVLTIPFPGFTRQPKESFTAPYMMAWQWAHKVRLLRAETAILFRPDHWWGALLTYIAGVPRRLGYDLPDGSPFLTDRVPFVPRHAVLQSAKLVETLTGSSAPPSLKLSYPIIEEDRHYIDDVLLTRQIPQDRPLVIIHGGAGTPIKQWSAENWAVTADKLAERLGAAVLFTGDSREHPQIRQIIERMRHRGISLAGETNIGQLAALYERADVVLGADSGPLHLAVASGAPTVHLFGPADPEEFGPWGDHERQIVLTSKIGCRPCRILDWPGDNPANHPCIRDISPRQVIDAALKAAQRK